MERTILVGLAVLTLLSAVGCSSLTVVTELNNQRFTLDEEPVAHLYLPLLLYPACDRRFRANGSHSLLP